MNRTKKIGKIFKRIFKDVLARSARVLFLSGIILFTLFPLGLHHSDSTTYRHSVPRESYDFPFESFVFMTVDVSVSINGTNLGKMSTSASGVVIQTMDTTRSYILTAGHVCDPRFGLPPMPDEMEEIIEIVSYDYYGFPHEASIVAVDDEQDLCLLASNDIWSDGSPLANYSPLTGEKIYAISAPQGIFSPGNALLFDGYFTGLDYSMNAFYTVPTKPGSSGAGIFNSRGQVVGIIHSAPETFENLAIASSLEEVKMFAYENVNVVVSF